MYDMILEVLALALEKRLHGCEEVAAGEAVLFWQKDIDLLVDDRDLVLKVNFQPLAQVETDDSFLLRRQTFER